MTTRKPPSIEPPPAVVKAVERALALVKGRLSAETIACMREEALLQLAAHPYPAALIRALSVPPAVKQSDVIAHDGPAPPSWSARGSAAGGTRTSEGGVLEGAKRPASARGDKGAA
jgi:hypothetical protein